MAYREFIRKEKATGNCPCVNCGNEQPGRNMQPFTVWWKTDKELRGHNEPMCSDKCCREWIDKKMEEKEW